MIIAHRVLTLRTETGAIKIVIRVFAPTEDSNGSWFCRYEIEWPDRPSDQRVGGADSLQALVLALQTIGAEIYSSNFHQSGKLFSGKPGEGYGFPVMPSLRHLLQGEDKKYL